MLDSLDHELCDPITSDDFVIMDWVEIDQEHLDLTAVAGIDQAGSVQAGHAVTEGESASGLDESCVPLGERQFDPSAHKTTAATGCQQGRLGSDEVTSGIGRVGVGRHHDVFAQEFDGHFDHDARVPLGPGSFPASVLGSEAMLAWIDLEMTGLEPDRHVIVEIASIVTDDELNIVAEGPDLVIHATEAQLAEMDPHVIEMHTSSGLLEKIKASTVTLAEAEAATLAFFAEHLGTENRVPLAGNSIGTDRRFLAAQMPQVEDFLHYRCIDVSTLKELARRWNPKVAKGAPGKKGAHRALDDIKESIIELRHYRDTFLRSPDA